MKAFPKHIGNLQGVPKNKWTMNSCRVLAGRHRVASMAGCFEGIGNTIDWSFSGCPALLLYESKRQRKSQREPEAGRGTACLHTLHAAKAPSPVEG